MSVQMKPLERAAWQGLWEMADADVFEKPGLMEEESSPACIGGVHVQIVFPQVAQTHDAACRNPM